MTAKSRSKKKREPAAVAGVPLEGDPYIERVALSAIRGWAENPKDHAIDDLEGSFEHYGFTYPPLLDELSGKLAAGHGRIQVLRKQKAEGGAPPARVTVREDGEWMVPVVRGVRFRSEEQVKAYLIADNRLTEKGGWNAEALEKLFEALPKEEREFTGWSRGELDELLAGAKHKVEFFADPNKVPEPPTTPITKGGDLWQLGDHRLLCDDSQDEAAVGRLMGDAKASVLCTDAPYGVDYTKTKNGIPRSGFRDIQERVGDIANDDLVDGPALQAFLERVFRTALPHLKEDCAFYLWHPMLTQGTFFAAAAAAAADVLIHRQIVWVKPHLVLTRSGQYHWKHELCFYGWRRGFPPPWYGDKGQTSVWEIGHDSGDRVHPTQKPIELFVPPILNHTRLRDVLYEPFAGSGSQLIAAEQQGRRCFAMEIDPTYCDVIVERWQSLTGEKARRAKR